MRFVLALCVSLAAFAAEPFTFIQMTDPQFGMYTANKDFAHETANLDFAIAAANRLKPAFVIITGDLINKPGDPAQTAEYKRLTAKLDPAIKLYSVAGNHDVENEPTPASLASYREHFGPDYYTFQHGGFTGIVLNSTLIQKPAKAQAEADKQEAWLKAELAKHKSAVIFLHHPIFIKTADEPDQYFNIPSATRRRYLELFAAHEVRYIFAGHYHRNAYGKAGEIEMITSGPIGKPLDGGKSGLRIAKVTDAGIEQKYYDFSDLP